MAQAATAVQQSQLGFGHGPISRVSQGSPFGNTRDDRDGVESVWDRIPQQRPDSHLKSDWGRWPRRMKPGEPPPKPATILHLTDLLSVIYSLAEQVDRRSANPFPAVAKPSSER
jgi:hypothetical protein